MKKIMCALMLLLSMTCFGQTYVEVFKYWTYIGLCDDINRFISNNEVHRVVNLIFTPDGSVAFLIYEGK